MPVNFIPGDSTQLVKAQLDATEGPMTSIVAYFNPKELTLDKAVPWAKHKNSEGDDPPLEYTASEPRMMNVELMFDCFEQRGDVHDEYISKLEELVKVDDTLKRPPMVTFTWGSALPVFKGVIEDLNVKYTLFLPDGTPTRATVTLKMKQATKLMNKQEADAASKKEKQEKGKTAATGSNRADQTNPDNHRGAAAGSNNGECNDRGEAPVGSRTSTH